MTINDFEMMEPMKYYDNPEPKTMNAQIKRNSIINGDLSPQYIATVKFDGDWAMFIHKSQGENLIRSRSISKITGKYGDYTAKLPALVEIMDNWADNTVLLGEICLSGENQNANTIGTILRCLPEKAIERQKTTPVEVHLFDALMVAGQDLTNKPYVERLKFINTYEFYDITNKFYSPIIFEDNFDIHADEIISNGGEGLVLQMRLNPYMPGTRTAWKTLKLKQCLPHIDLKVIGTIEPNKNYCGDFAINWPYQIDGVNVTKPYYMGWKNGIRVLLTTGITTDITSGLTDDDRAFLATDEAQVKIAAGELWAEVKAMSINDLGKLRHGSLVRLRTDLNSDGE